MKTERSPYWHPHLMRDTDRMLEDADAVLRRKLMTVYREELPNWQFGVTVILFTVLYLVAFGLVIHEWPLIKALWSMR